MSKENTIFHNLPPFNFQSEGYRLCRIECFFFFNDDGSLQYFVKLRELGQDLTGCEWEEFSRHWFSDFQSIEKKRLAQVDMQDCSKSLAWNTIWSAFLTTQWNSVSFLELLSGSAPFDQHDVRLSGPLVFIFVSGHMNDEFGLVRLSLFGLSWIWFTVTSISFWG